MPVRSFAQSFRCTATKVSQAHKLPGRPESVLEVRNLGDRPVYARLGGPTDTVEVIGYPPTRALYVPPGGVVDLDVNRRTHLVLLAPDKDCDIIVTQGAG